MSADIGGAPPEKSKAVTIALVVGLALVISGIVVYVSLPTPSDIPLVPENVPRTSQDGVSFYFDEFKLQERMVSVTIDFPKDGFHGAYWQLDKDVDSVLWVEYGGVAYPALVKMTMPMRLPPGSKTWRFRIIGHLKKDDPAPEAGEAIKGGLQIPDHLLKRSTHLRLVVDKVERVAK